MVIGVKNITERQGRDIINPLLERYQIAYWTSVGDYRYATDITKWPADFRYNSADNAWNYEVYEPDKMMTLCEFVDYIVGRAKEKTSEGKTEPFENVFVECDWETFKAQLAPLLKARGYRWSSGYDVDELTYHDTSSIQIEGKEVFRNSPEGFTRLSLGEFMCRLSAQPLVEEKKKETDWKKKYEELERENRHVVKTAIQKMESVQNRLDKAIEYIKMKV